MALCCWAFIETILKIKEIKCEVEHYKGMLKIAKQVTYFHNNYEATLKFKKMIWNLIFKIYQNLKFLLFN